MPTSTPSAPGHAGVLAATARVLREHRAITVVLVAFVASMFFVGTRANVTILDDWIYIRQAKEFASAPAAPRVRPGGRERDLRLHLGRRVRDGARDRALGVPVLDARPRDDRGRRRVRREPRAARPQARERLRGRARALQPRVLLAELLVHDRRALHRADGLVDVRLRPRRPHPAGVGAVAARGQRAGRRGVPQPPAGSPHPPGGAHLPLRRSSPPVRPRRLRRCSCRSR